MIVDLHHHYLPPEVFDRLGGGSMLNSRYNDGKTIVFGGIGAWLTAARDGF